MPYRAHSTVGVLVEPTILERPKIKYKPIRTEEPNYDDSTKEPTVLPAQYPNLLVNGASGIAVGMATNIPPHNLLELNIALIKLII